MGGGFAALADGAIGLAGAAGSIRGAASLAGRHSHCQERRLYPWTHNQNTCFTAGTPIKLPDGTSKPIERFAVGDAILTKDEFRPESAPVAGVVIDTFARVSEVLHVWVKGVTIEATAEHPLWVVGRGWIPAAEVRAGDRLLTSDGRAVECDGVDRPGRVATVYNVTVDPGHTYFVGHEVWGFDVWAHNAKYSSNRSQQSLSDKRRAAAQSRWDKQRAAKAAGLEGTPAGRGRQHAQRQQEIVRQYGGRTEQEIVLPNGRVRVADVIDGSGRIHQFGDMRAQGTQRPAGRERGAIEDIRVCAGTSSRHCGT